MGHGTVFHISVAIQQTHMPSGTLKPQQADMPLPMLLTDGELPTSADLTDDDARRVLVIDDNADVAAFIGSQLSDKYGIVYRGFARWTQLNIYAPGMPSRMDAVH